MIKKDVKTSLLKYQSCKTGNNQPTHANEAASLQDGVVDFREYVMAISMLIDGSAVEKLRWSFRLYDKDSDGAITREEMLEIMQVCVCVHVCVLSDISNSSDRGYRWCIFQSNCVSFCPQAVYKMSVAAALTKANSLTAEECTNRIFVRLDKDNNGEEMIFPFLPEVMVWCFFHMGPNHTHSGGDRAQSVQNFTLQKPTTQS